MKRADLFFTGMLVPLDAVALIAASAVAYALRFTTWLETIREVVFELTFGEYMTAVLWLAA